MPVSIHSARHKLLIHATRDDIRSAEQNVQANVDQLVALDRGVAEQYQRGREMHELTVKRKELERQLKIWESLRPKTAKDHWHAFLAIFTLRTCTFLVALALMVVLLIFIFTRTNAVTACGGFIKAKSSSSGVIASPNYPNYHDNNVNCIWLIEAEKDLVVSMEIEPFGGELAANNSCEDYVEVRAGSEDAQLLYHSCNITKTVSISSTSQWLWLRFYSNERYTTTGFTSSWTVTAGGFGNQSNPIKDCSWTRFHCANRECISWSWVCDGWNDCGCTSGCDEDKCAGFSLDYRTTLAIGVGTGVFIFLAIIIIIVLLEKHNKHKARVEEIQRQKMAVRYKRQKEIEKYEMRAAATAAALKPKNETNGPMMSSETVLVSPETAEQARVCPEIADFRPSGDGGEGTSFMQDVGSGQSATGQVSGHEKFSRDHRVDVEDSGANKGSSSPAITQGHKTHTKVLRLLPKRLSSTLEECIPEASSKDSVPHTARIRIPTKKRHREQQQDLAPKCHVDIEEEVHASDTISGDQRSHRQRTESVQSAPTPRSHQRHVSEESANHSEQGVGSYTRQSSMGSSHSGCHESIPLAWQRNGTPPEPSGIQTTSIASTSSSAALNHHSTPLHGADIQLDESFSRRQTRVQMSSRDGWPSVSKRRRRTSPLKVLLHASKMSPASKDTMGSPNTA